MYVLHGLQGFNGKTTKKTPPVDFHQLYELWLKHTVYETKGRAITMVQWLIVSDWFRVSVRSIRIVHRININSSDPQP